ncbi:MAG: sugar ABC transporter ATP-binding protein [Sulfobacillus benefaciens]|uniref:Autoinducer 2 import ATP-binding protein LsrA n=1 Tax=Sulfobacillus benefaciens TaxID=453960 RepID=A0A2T2WUP8_9FIRM|nr:MAG: sugar ABC transporter ATP-binding protein [Sulfobacillus benefaciens]
MSEVPVLEVIDINKTYNHVPVLRDVSLRVDPGQVRALIGHNGAGKSTLLRILAGAESPDSGLLKVAGMVRTFSSPRDAQNAGVAAVYQELRLLPELTVAENIYLGQEARSGVFLDRRTMARSARQVLEAHHVLIDPYQKVRYLSHAQRQLVEVIAALERNAKVILLDEPTTALQSEQIDDLITTVKNIAYVGQVGVIFVSHKLEEVWAIADVITVLRDGGVVLDASKDSVDKETVTQFIVGDAYDQQQQDPTNNSIPGVHNTSPSGESNDEEPLLTVRSVESAVLHNISLDVKRGEVLGLYGLVGSGRSDFFKLLYGLHPLLSGTIYVQGKSYHPRSPRDAMNHGIAYVTEERKYDGFIPMLSTIQNVALPSISRYQTAGWVHRDKVDRAVNDIIKPLNLRGDVNRAVKTLSGGNQQKMLFARTLLQEPQLVLLDEPTKGIDIGAKAEIHRLVRKFASEKGVGVLVISSEEEELLTVSDRIIVFRGGFSSDAFEARHLTETQLRNLAL